MAHSTVQENNFNDLHQNVKMVLNNVKTLVFLIPEQLISKTILHRGT